MRRVEAGESFVVTRRGVPVADLLPDRNTAVQRPTFAPTSDLDEALAALPEWGLESYDRERAALDAVVDDADRDPWQ